VVLLMMLVMAVTSVQAQSEPPRPMKPDVGPGRVAWFDITTTDLAKSKEFYGKLFDWKFNSVEGTDYAVEIVAGEAAIGDIRVAEGKISPFDGVVYVQVSDIRESCKKANDLGGTVVPGFPFDLSDGKGAIGLITDPAGHPLGMYSRTPLVPQEPQPLAKPVAVPQQSQPPAKPGSVDDEVTVPLSDGLDVNVHVWISEPLQAADGRGPVRVAVMVADFNLNHLWVTKSVYTGPLETRADPIDLGTKEVNIGLARFMAAQILGEGDSHPYVRELSGPCHVSVQPKAGKTWSDVASSDDLDISASMSK
jgi:predicted enzyme related to lactoylglutathione lyase